MGLRQFVKKWVMPPGFSELVGGVLYDSRQARPATPQPEPASENDMLLRAGKDALRDRHRGRRCFILCGGSSVKKQNLAKLAGEMVISVSNTFVHPEYALFKPAYHVLPPIGGHPMYELERYVVWLREMEAKTFEAEMFFHISDRGLIEENGLFRGRIIHWLDFAQWDGSFDAPLDLTKLPSVYSVSELALSVSLYMGFDSIYLLGLDHDWFNGPLVYFYDEKTEHAVRPEAGKLAFADAEFQMRRHAEIFRKYKYLYAMKKNIYNANYNSDSYVDVFPKVSYDSLF